MQDDETRKADTAQDTGNPQDTEYAQSAGHAGYADMESRIFQVLGACEDLPAFQERIAEFVRAMGFDSFSYILLGDDRHRLLRPRRVCCTLPETLVSDYDTEAYHHDDIALDYAFHNAGARFYSDLQGDLGRTPYETRAKRINREIYNLYRAHGYYDLYLVPLHRGGRTALFSVGLTDTTATTLAQTARKIGQDEEGAAGD